MIKSDVECIDGLKATHTQEWGELQQLHSTKQFDLLNLFDDVFGENSWSRILAFLFRSNDRHQLGAEVFRAWLDCVESETKASLLKFPKNWKTEVKVEQFTDEGRRIDILVKVRDTNDKLQAIFAIENKLDANEQENQLRDYQHWICDNFSSVDAQFLFFLTPDRRSPQTHDEKSKCQVIACSYETVTGALKSVRNLATNDVDKIIGWLIVYLDERAKMTKEAEKRISKLFENPDDRRAILLICEHCPCMGKVIEQVKFKLQNSNTVKALRGGKDGINVKSWPRDCSKDASHWDFYFPEIETPGIGIKLTYCLSNILIGDHKTAEIGDSFLISIIAWVTAKGSARTRAEKLKKRCRLPKMENDWSDRLKGWDHHVFFWGGESYTLRDLSSKDVNGLSKLIEDSLTVTYKRLANVIV